jgi:hypothetical protein
LKLKTIQGRKSDEIFWPNFVKGTGALATYKKPLLCGCKDGVQVIIPDYLEFNGQGLFLLLVQQELLIAAVP